MQTRKMRHESIEKRKFWQHHIAQCEKLSSPQKKYCEENKISLHSFIYWRGVLKRENVKIHSSDFIPVTMNATHLPRESSLHFIEIKLANGHVVKLPTALDAIKIADILRHLGAAHD